MNWIFIEPGDVWLFRDGRPFDAGADHQAVSLFPPTPNTIQGMLRSRFLAEQGVDLERYADPEADLGAVAEAIGRPGGAYGRLRLKGPLVARYDSTGSAVQRYVPLPADVVRIGDSFRLARPLRTPAARANWPDGNLRPLWVRAEGEAVPAEARGWLPEGVLPAYLEGKDPAPSDVVSDQELSVREPRFGVGIASDRKRAKEGLLYQVEFVRVRRGVGLAVGIQGVALAQRGLLQAGGEQRAARFWSVSPAALPGQAMPAPDAEGRTRFRMVLLTPARFDGGWRPVDPRWSQFFDRPVTLVAAALPRCQSLGGARVDHASQRQGGFQKHMWRYAPAGSVYFFESDGPVQTTRDHLTNDESEGQIGFGMALPGRWEYASL